MEAIPHVKTKFIRDTFEIKNRNRKGSIKMGQKQ